MTVLEKVFVPSEKKLKLEKFSFKKARKRFENYQGSINDAIVEERKIPYESIHRYVIISETVSSGRGF